MSRYLGFLEGLFSGFDRLQDLYQAQQRELEWRSNMELMVEQLGLQLRALQSENLRLKQELFETRKEPLRYGTPEDKSSLDQDEMLNHAWKLWKKGWGRCPARTF